MLATVVSEKSAAYILDFVLSKFPPTVSTFRSSLGYEIVSRLSRSLSQLPYPSNGKPEGLDDRCHHSQTAPSVLEDLALLLQSGLFEEGEPSKRKTAQTSRRKVITGNYAEINDRLFGALGPQLPSTRESVEDTIKSIINNQKATLKVSTPSFHHIR